MAEQGVTANKGIIVTPLLAVTQPSVIDAAYTVVAESAVTDKHIPNIGTRAAVTGRRIICGECRGSIEPWQPVWRTSDQWRRWALCAACARRPGDPTDWYPPRACAGCRRPVSDPRRRRYGHPAPPRRWAACSFSCEQRARYQARTAATRHKVCTVCGAAFTPPRADGRYCSPACRQRAYRQRRAS